MLEELRNVKYGDLHMWRRQHREEILEYFQVHGEAETMDRYRFCQKDAFGRFVEHTPMPRFNCEKFTKVDKAGLLAEIAIAGTRENQKEIRELKEAYQAFINQVGEDLTRKLFLPLLRLCIKLDNPIFNLPADKLNLEELFGEEPEQSLESSSSGGPGVMADEAEAMLSLGPVDLDGLGERLDTAWRNLYDLFVEACQSEDWGSALADYQWMKELDYIRENEEGEEFIKGAEEWLAMAEKPAELGICC